MALLTKPKPAEKVPRALIFCPHAGEVFQQVGGGGGTGGGVGDAGGEFAGAGVVIRREECAQI